MTIQQQYYTSCRKTDQSGFQVKAESRGVEDDVRQLLNQLIGYQIPYHCDSAAISTHPIALRYFTKDNQAFLVSSQSSGKDEFGRDGNFFAHSAIATPQDFCASSVPIFYWKSPFWASSDLTEQSELPSLEEFEAEVTFDFDAIWSFLDQGNRREWFYKLLCAVIDYEQSKRKIVIVDGNEEIAFWIACVSMAFPARYVQFLSFATYHHDPYTAPFIITGTTVDGNFRFTSDEYYSYFILNTFDNRISEVPESEYARHLTQYFDSDEHYGDVILDFFEWLRRYDPESIIKRQLDDYTNFRLATHPSPKAIQGAELVLSELYNKTSFEEEDINDLISAYQLLKEVALPTSTSNNLRNSYTQTIEKLKQRDRTFSPTEAVTELNIILVAFVLNQQEQDVKFLSKLLETTDPTDSLTKTLNHENFVRALAQHLNIQQPQRILMFWKYLGIKMALSPSIESAFTVLLEESLAVFSKEKLYKEFDIPDLLTQVLNIVIEISQIQPEFIIICAERCQEQLPAKSQIVEWVYYDLARRFPFEQRQLLLGKYWQADKKLIPELNRYLYRYELQRELFTSQNVSESINVINAWISNINEGWCPIILEESLNFLWNNKVVMWTQVEREQLPRQLLNHTRISSFLNDNLYNQLVKDLLSYAKIAQPSKEDATLYANILQHPLLYHKIAELIIIQGSLDLYNNQLTEVYLEQYYQYFQQIDLERYKREAGNLLKGFFNINHYQVLQATYIEEQRHNFWEVYWSQFTKCLLNQQQGANNATIILDFWFNNKPPFPKNLRYLVPDFFTGLPKYLQEVKKAKGYNQIKDNFEVGLRKKSWYRIIEPIIKEQSNKNWFIFSNSKSSEQPESERYKRKVGNLLKEFFDSRGELLNCGNKHFEIVQRSYIEQQRHNFWEIYWFQFKECLLNQQQGVNIAAETLDYWFEAQSYFSGSLPYFVPDFFTGLPKYLQEVKKAKGYNQIKSDFEGNLSRKVWSKVIEPVINEQSSKNWLEFPKFI